MADAPILLSRTNSLDSRIMDEVLRFDAQTVYLLGGEAALSSNVEQELVSAGINVERVSRAPRYLLSAEELTTLALQITGKATWSVPSVLQKNK